MHACGSDPSSGSPDFPTAATLGEQQPMTVAEYQATPPYSDADLDNGARQAVACRACHTLNAGGADRVGPNLHRIFGRDFVWTPRALEAWLAAPGKFLPGNRMSFTGVSNASDRNDLVAYLLTETNAE